MDAGVELRNQLEQITANGSCPGLSPQGRVVFEAVIADLDQAMLDYDDETMHGATMGVQFP